jgi:hypothetical protein
MQGAQRVVGLWCHRADVTSFSEARNFEHPGSTADLLPLATARQISHPLGRPLEFYQSRRAGSTYHPLAL